VVAGRNLQRARKNDGMRAGRARPSWIGKSPRRITGRKRTWRAKKERGARQKHKAAAKTSQPVARTECSEIRSGTRTGRKSALKQTDAVTKQLDPHSKASVHSYRYCKGY
jgi:hypothetical protein